MNGPKEKESNLETATLAGGCFWCTEAIFNELKGVKKVVSGYSGGRTENPAYEQVLSGATGHAESVKITYDPAEISYEDLLRVFFSVHDPTTPNRQGSDIGTQYRSAIFYQNEEQKEIAEKVIAEIELAKLWDEPIVTELRQYTNFYEAEPYHQHYFSENPDQPYCRAIIAPKMAKFRKQFIDKLKKAA